jgi:GrpB-like predicted nucleotidyltransferase (UPF0157 family)/chloramphenicol 3-O-phosphotransferase
MRSRKATGETAGSKVLSESGPVYIISGPMAAGKSTVARLLAERFIRGVYLEGDFFRRSIVSGRVEMTPDASTEALEQLRLRYRLAAAAADTYSQAGFTVVLEDVIAGELLVEYRASIQSRPCHVVVLMPSREAIAEREAQRANKGYTRWTVTELYEAFEVTPRVGLWLDTSYKTAEETVEEILACTCSETTPVIVCDYDEAWPKLFREIAAPVQTVLSDIVVAVEHVGSTAVPGVAAKPVIDVDVVLHSAEEVPMAIERLRELGYLYQGDKGIAGREAFLRPPQSPVHHLYVVVAGSKPLADHIEFRDYLRSNPQAAREYGELKRALADEHRNDRHRYTDAKERFISQTLARQRAISTKQGRQ